MEYVRELLGNRIFWSAVIGWFAAQASKNLLEFCKGEHTKDRLTGGGGMPSAHSATVVSLASAVAIVEGMGGGSFVVALFLAFIVIYDALGVRYTTGREAAALNRIRQAQIERGEEPCIDKPLQEHMGHTLAEVIAGGVIGLAASIIVCILVP